MNYIRTQDRACRSSYALRAAAAAADTARDELETAQKMYARVDEAHQLLPPLGIVNELELYRNVFLVLCHINNFAIHRDVA